MPWKEKPGQGLEASERGLFGTEPGGHRGSKGGSERQVSRMGGGGERVGGEATRKPGEEASQASG